MSQFSDLESLIALTSSLDSGKLEEVYSSVATHIGAQGAAKIAEAVTELQSIGLDPSMYIAPSKAYQRRQRELARLAPEQQAQAQRLQHQQDMHDIEVQRQQLELRKLQAEVQVLEGSATRINAGTPSNA